MKKWMMLFLLAGFLTPAWAVYELPSCDELTDIANVLDDVNDELDRLGTIEEDSELDQALGDVITALEDIARIEDSKRLDKAVRRLAKAWDDMQLDDFQDALDAVAVSFDKIYNAECP